MGKLNAIGMTLISLLTACSVDSNPSRRSEATPASEANAERDESSAAAGPGPASAPENAPSNSSTKPETLDISAANAGSFTNFGAKADDYNIVLIFDKSGSRSITDPKLVSRDGAQKLVQDIATAVSAHQNVKVRIAVVSFSVTAAVGATRWHELTHVSNDTAGINAAIDEAVTAPNGATDYMPPLKLAEELLKEQGADPKKTRQRNYIVFLTDGMPTPKNGGTNFTTFTSASLPKEYLNGLAAAIDNLVTNQGVAFMAIAAGEEIKKAGLLLVKSMALPTTGTVDAAHVGKYVRATNDVEMKKAWDILLLAIAS